MATVAVREDTYQGLAAKGCSVRQQPHDACFKRDTFT